jgi:hypothetical protein
VEATPGISRGRHHRDHLPKKARRSQIEDKAIIAIEILSRKWLAGRKVADIHFSDMEQLRATDRNLPSVVICAEKLSASALKT